MKPNKFLLPGLASRVGSNPEVHNYYENLIKIDP